MEFWTSCLGIWPISWLVQKISSPMRCRRFRACKCPSSGSQRWRVRSRGSTRSSVPPCAWSRRALCRQSAHSPGPSGVGGSPSRYVSAQWRLRPFAPHRRRGIVVPLHGPTRRSPPHAPAAAGRPKAWSLGGCTRTKCGGRGRTCAPRPRRCPGFGRRGRCSWRRFRRQHRCARQSRWAATVSGTASAGTVPHRIG
jgi:hypothetical protein